LRKSIISRFFALILLALLLAIGVSGFISVDSAFKLFAEETQKTLIREVRLLASILPDSVSQSALDSLINTHSFPKEIRFTIIDSRGKVLADSEKDPAEMDDHSTRPEIVSAIGSGEGSSIRYSATLREHLVYSAARTASGDFIIRASKPLTSLMSFKNRHTRKIIPLTLGLIIAAFIITIFSKSSIIKKIDNLSFAADRISKGEFEARAPETEDSEFSGLERSINRMAGAIEASFDDLRRGKEQLARIIDGLREGIVLIEGDRIAAMNNVASALLGLGVAVGLDALSSIRIPEIINLIERKEKGPVEFDRDGGIFEARLIPFEAGESTILVIRDIGEEARIRRTKADFVANVSHELKTPLTLIKGYAETLEREELTDEQSRFVEVISRHTGRMIAIVEDLLTLSKVESGAVQKFDTVSLSGLLGGILPMFENRAASNGITIKTALDETPLVLGEASLLEIAIANLLDNAIKYSRSGGEVIISLASKPEGVALSVKDNGIGIPPEDRGKIFERFYTVDKAHSHQLGGTGLGLAIVKNIVSLHSGSLALECPDEGGCVFTITLPASAS